MEKTSNTHRSRARVIFLSILLLIASIFLITALINMRPEPGEVETLPLVPAKVEAMRLKRGTQLLRTRVYGTARADKQIILRAPISGTATAAESTFAGSQVPQGQPLFSIDGTKLRLQARQRRAQQESVDVRQRKTETDIVALKGRIAAAEELLRLGEINLASKKKSEEIARTLYDKQRRLYEREAISEVELLQAETTLRQAEQAAIEAARSIETTQDALLTLEQTLATAEYDLAVLINDREEIELEIAQIADDLAKTTINAEFPTQVISVEVDQEEEVSSGAVLATIRSRDRVEVDLSLPDSLFPWVFQPDSLLNRISDTLRIPLSLVNQYYPVTYQGARIKAISGEVSDQTRSLTITVERENPKDASGSPIPESELRPGMYLAALLPLAQIDNVFLVPSAAMQESGDLFLIEDNVIRRVSEVEQLYDGPDGIIVRLPDTFEEIHLVTQPLYFADTGTRVEPVRDTVADRSNSLSLLERL